MIGTNNFCRLFPSRAHSPDLFALSSFSLIRRLHDDHSKKVKSVEAISSMAFRSLLRARKLIRDAKISIKMVARISIIYSSLQST